MLVHPAVEAEAKSNAMPVRGGGLGGGGDGGGEGGDGGGSGGDGGSGGGGLKTHAMSTSAMCTDQYVLADDKRNATARAPVPVWTQPDVVSSMNVVARET